MKRILTTAAMLAMPASAAMALEAKVTKETTASPAAAWATIGDFCGIATWHPAVAKCEPSSKDGASYRTLTLKDGAKLVEKLVSADAKAMSYTYTIEEGPLPVSGYKSTLKVVPAGQGAAFDWSGTFDAKGAADADVVKTITGIYAAGVDGLVQKTSK